MNGLEVISGRTDGQTDGRDSLGLQRLRRETKKLENSDVPIWRKVEQAVSRGLSTSDRFSRKEIVKIQT